jgi:hypothetical protein
VRIGLVRGRAVDQERPQMLVALLADAQQDASVAARVLSGHEAEPGSQMPPVPEIATIADGGDHRCGGLGANALYPTDPLAQGAAPEDLLDAPIEIP